MRQTIGKDMSWDGGRALQFSEIAAEPGRLDAPVAG